MRRTHFILQPMAVITLAFAWLLGAGLLAFACQSPTRISKPQTPSTQNATPNTQRQTPNAQHPTPSTQRTTPNTDSPIRGISVEPRDISLNGLRSEGRIV